jgi:FtsP/CotA-like multicopper oxidase with cupredoxin domain
MAKKDSYRIGALYPRVANGSPNLILSSGYQLVSDGSDFLVKQKSSRSKGRLSADLTITTDPVQLPGVSQFVIQWLKPQMLAKEDPNSIFHQYWKAFTENGWGVYPNNLFIEAASYLGYRGYGWDKGNESTGFWAKTSDASSELYTALLDLSNYQPELVWGSPGSNNIVKSNFDTEALLANLDKLAGTFSGDAPLWLPSMLFTYGIKGKGTSYPGPVLMIQPGEKLKLNFENNIQIPGLSKKQNQDATLVPNSSYGLNGGSTAGGMFSTNFHMHGGHVNPSGFGDNVVARYTSGQNWTTSIKIPKDHGEGSYWYHPHYHPAVNTQLYGGLSGFMQVGDPLNKVPLFKDVPRNLAVLKTMQVEANPASSDYELAAVNGNFLGFHSLAPNRSSMFTVNGEYMPTVDVDQGGWQALTLTNQDNNYYMNISIRHQQSNGEWIDLPLYIYGEDGHQYPQIRSASHGALGYAQEPGQNATAYAQSQNLISLPAGKRVDVLFYLPSGESELVSSYRFTSENGNELSINNLRFPSNEYVDLSSTNVSPGNPLSGPGPIARWTVQGDELSPSLEQLNQTIKRANRGIKVQTITPETRASDYDSHAVPSVNLYAQDKNGVDRWQPIRRRELNYSVLSLVGPADERDIPTQQALAESEASPGGKKYNTYTPVPGPTWLGYENPDFINDHVFPNGPLIITQLGTLEEWSLKNWNWNGPDTVNGGYLTGHPFHIHVNDYQVKQSDTELPNKRNLEDVTMLNSSGYHYADSTGAIQKIDPLVGSFTAIPEAFDYLSPDSAYNPDSPNYNGPLFTTGYTDTTIRMLFQDFLGTYVHHCHLLEHEDAGMMQVVTVIENTDSSWLLPAEDLRTTSKGLVLREADSLANVVLRLDLNESNLLKRGQVGDLSGDFVQDIILTTSGSNLSPASVLIYDGASLKDQHESKLITTIHPYRQSNLAPWAFNSDFTGDGQRELVTAGFVKNSGNRVDLRDFQITGWEPLGGSDEWKATYVHNPWLGVGSLPEAPLSSSLTSFAVGDFNLDNFDDYATAYLSDGKLRIRLLDGASVSLFLQTGIDENGYLPNTAILSDMTYSAPDLSGVDSVVLTTGFNSYAQSPIENLIVTTSSKSGHASALTFQLNAGHFIATGTSSHDTSSSHSESADHHGGSGLPSSGVVDNTGPLPLQLTATRHWHGSSTPATPTFTGVRGQGSLLLDDALIIGQGTSSDGFTYGNTSSSDLIDNTTQDLFVTLDGIDRVSRDDLTGIVSTDLGSRLGSMQPDQRLNLSMLAFQAYTNQMVTPSDLAVLSAGNHGGALPVTDLVSRILDTYSSQVSSYYGADLDQLKTNEIVNKAYATLYRRTPTATELQRWNREVNLGLDKTNLPIAILQNSSGRDELRVALLSAATRWSQVQWGTTAVVDGSYGQGFQADRSSFDSLSQSLFSSQSPGSWQFAQQLFDRYRGTVINALDGTPISDTGFF